MSPPPAGYRCGMALVDSASLLAEVVVPYQSAFNAAKHGVRVLAETARRELRVTSERRVGTAGIAAGTIAAVARRHGRPRRW